MENKNTGPSATYSRLDGDGNALCYCKPTNMYYTCEPRDGIALRSKTRILLYMNQRVSSSGKDLGALKGGEPGEDAVMFQITIMEKEHLENVVAFCQNISAIGITGACKM
ncbi:hypothetical protein J3459_015235 [Metarhizium acridum]|nr:hypothetical protein J3459_015235 [Metarhizium acridum]